MSAELERWQHLWETASTRSGAALVQHNFAVRPEAPLGHLSAGVAGSRYAMLQALNRELARAGENVSIVDCGGWRRTRAQPMVRRQVLVPVEAGGCARGAAAPGRHTAAVAAARLGLSEVPGTRSGRHALGRLVAKTGSKGSSSAATEPVKHSLPSRSTFSSSRSAG